MKNMTTNISELQKLVCPVCGKPLTSEEYKHALHKLENTIEEKYEKELDDRTGRIKENLEQIYSQKLQNKEEELRDQRKMFQIQIERAKKEAEDRITTLTLNQSELTGEIGERNLYDILREAFTEEQDYFERNKRGTEMADIIHTIITPNGKIETQIVYDNKSSSTVTKHDIEKAKRYKEIHNTPHVFIVSSNLPREIKNGRIGQKEGVVLVHPSVIVEVVKIIRQEIIRISNYAKTREEKESKETKLYNYITSDEFWRLIDENLSEYKHMKDELEKEEKYHQKIFKERKEHLKKLKDNMNCLKQNINTIITASN